FRWLRYRRLHQRPTLLKRRRKRSSATKEEGLPQRTQRVTKEFFRRGPQLFGLYIFRSKRGPNDFPAFSVVSVVKFFHASVDRNDGRGFTPWLCRRSQASNLVERHRCGAV